MQTSDVTPAQRDRWYAKGKREQTAAMIEQGGYSVRVYENHKAKLISFGFGEDRHQQMAEWLAELERVLGARGWEKAEARRSTRVEAAAMDGAKEHAFLLKSVLPIVLRDRQLESSMPEELAPSGELKRSTPRVLNYLRSIRGTVVRLEEDLTPYFQGRSPTQVHDEVTAALANADRTQETLAKALPQETRTVHETKGALLEAIEDMNRIGRVAYRGQAELAARFNKDILLRARRVLRKKPAAEAEPQGSDDEPTDPATEKPSES